MAEAAVLTPPGTPSDVEPPDRPTEDYAGEDVAGEEAAPPAVRQRPRLRHRISHHTQKLNESSKEWLRAGVFGGMDGLSSTVGILAATAALPTATMPILLATGASAGIAGAASMGAGEYVSVKTDNERLFRAIDQVKRNHEANPAQAQAELAELLIDQVGLDPEEAQIWGNRLWENPKLAQFLQTGLKLEEYPGEPVKPRNAALSSFTAFGLGALLPVAPYIAAGAGGISGGVALPLSMAAGGLGLFGAGAAASKFTGGTWWKNGLRQLAAGGVAAGLSYGSAVGVTALAGASLASVAIPVAATAAGIAAVAIAATRIIKRRKSKQAAREHRAETVSKIPTEADAASSSATSDPDAPGGVKQTAVAPEITPVPAPAAPPVTTPRPAGMPPQPPVSQSMGEFPPPTATNPCPQLADSPTQRRTAHSSSPSR